MEPQARHLHWAIVCLGATVACTGAEVDPGTPGPTSIASSIASGIDLTAAPTTGGLPTTGGGSDDGEVWTTTTSAPDLPNSTCKTVQLSGETVARPVDILFAIDTSSSMSQEAASVIANMNAFSGQIVASGIDARVVLIASQSMCIAPPLGSGLCGGADDSPGRFLHIDEVVNSDDALEKILTTANGWRSFLREDATRHVVVVSDDDSAMPAINFYSKFSTLLPGDGSFIFHGIVSALDPDSECGSDPACCDLTADEGTVYLQLIAKTGGVFGDLCDQDFAPVFAALAAYIADTAPIGCAWTLPPSNEDPYDYAATVVRVTLDGDAFADATQVAGPAACPPGVFAWYFDNPQAPAQLHACPWTCDQLTAAPAASVTIELPCLPPVVG